MKYFPLALLSLALVACGPTGSADLEMKSEAVTPKTVEPEPVVTTPSSSPTEATTPETEPELVATSQEPIARNGAGLGDTRSNFEEVYGPNLGDETFGRYENDYIQTTYTEDDVISEVVVQFSKRYDGDRETIDEAIAAASPFLPSDAVKIGEWEHDATQYVVHFESKKLASVYPESEDWQWFDAPPGTFIVLLTHEEYKPQEVFAVYISPGNPNHI